MFVEAYHVGPKRDHLVELPLEEFAPFRYLPRMVPQPEYAIDRSYQPVRKVRRQCKEAIEIGKSDNFLEPVREQGFKCFSFSELEFNAYTFLKRYVRDDNGPVIGKLYRGRINNTGFIKLTVNCKVPGSLVVMFAETEAPGGGVEPFGNEAIDAVFWDLKEPGRYELEALEVHTFQYAEIFMANGAADVLDFSLREYKSPLAWNYEFATDNPDFSAIFEAGRETFAANAVDCFTDCPGRERAAWLCDSYFTAQTSFLLTGDTRLERFFLENFAYADSYEHIPHGAIPMLYPGDHPNGMFIPNWAMWLIIQVGDYFERSKDTELVGVFKAKFLAFLHYLDTFLNSDGLLEKLPSWVFVEWSKANSFVQDVNYPSNMLYAAALETMARLYSLPDFRERADRMRKTIREQSWNGMWFRDHAVRQENGSLMVPENDITETCQYYALFFRCATRKTHPGLWRTLGEDFGPERVAQKRWPEIWPSNAFIGNYLRLDLLSRAGLHQQVIREACQYFKKMADTTGTLWEFDNPSASCCHGFASYINVLLVKAQQSGEIKSEAR